jgi:OmpA-OmpF porin, OOP family
MTSLRWLRAALMAVVSTTVLPAFGAGKAVELPGGQDPPVVSRFKGSVLQNAASERSESLRIPMGPGKTLANGALGFDASVIVQGKISAYHYVQAADVSLNEVYQNYRTALQAAGFEPLYSCEPAACQAAQINERYRTELLYPRKWNSGRISPGGGSSPRELRFWAGKATRGGADVYVIVWVSEADSMWERAQTSIVVVEPAAMVTGQVVASLQQMQSGLQAEGKIALYGLYFDTGKAEVKPESKPQLEEIAKLLKAAPDLRVYIVGHTDNQGSLETNQPLSQRRAEAVAGALAALHGIAARRMTARGVASLAPVASNAAELGRAKNRRVELVAQ